MRNVHALAGHVRPRDRRKTENRKGPCTTWQIVLPKSCTVDGKPRYVPFKGTKREAQSELLRLHLEMSGGGVLPSGLKLHQYFDLWLKNKAAEGLADRTMAAYRSHAHIYVVPSLGSIPLRKLSPAMVRAALTEWASRTHDGKPMSKRTLRHVYFTLRSALQDACREELLLRNPCDSVKPPKKGHANVRTASEKDAIRLLRGLAGTDLGLPASVALYTGLRRGELLALHWSDIDFSARVLRVNQSLEMITDNEGRSSCRFKAPKTERSRRSIALGETALSLLKRQRIVLAKRRLALGSSYNSKNLVFPDPQRGLEWRPDRFSSAFYRCVRSLNLPVVSFHSLRHSFASISVRSGTDLKVISESLGHSTISTTADLYMHVVERQQHEAAIRFDAAMRDAMVD